MRQQKSYLLLVRSDNKSIWIRVSENRGFPQLCQSVHYPQQLAILRLFQRLQLSFGLIYRVNVHSHHEGAFSRFKTLPVKKSIHQLMFRFRIQKRSSRRLIHSHWLFSPLQARGKKRQRGWFHSSHVKLLGPSSSKSSPSPLPGECWHTANTAFDLL